MTIRTGSVKLCSLREVEHVAWAVEAAPDMFGLIFVESAWRKVTPAMGKAIVTEFDVLAGSQRPKAVGVFLDSKTDEINHIADQVQLDYVQVHVRETAVDWTLVERPVLPVLRPQTDAELTEISAAIESILETGANVPAILLDAWHKESVGGAGVLGNWSIARDLASKYPIVLAGGLSPQNVREAIEAIGPAGVDVSTGVETDRTKDPAKMKAFVTAAREAFAARLVGNVN